MNKSIGPTVAVRRLSAKVASVPCDSQCWMDVSCYSEVFKGSSIGLSYKGVRAVYSYILI